MGNSMSDLSFDDLIEDAWREFASTLALRLPRLETGQYIEVTRQDGQRHRVLVAFTAADSGKIRCTLDSALLRSSDRAEWIRTRGQLAQLGWRFLPRKDNHMAQAGHGDIPRLTQLAVSTLREVFGHAHPVFVMINDPFRPAARTSFGELHDLTAALDALPDCVATGYVVESEAELLAITRDVVATLLGSQVAIVDGCIELPALDVVPWRIFASPQGPSLVFTRPSRTGCSTPRCWVGSWSTTRRAGQTSRSPSTVTTSMRNESSTPLCCNRRTLHRHSRRGGGFSPTPRVDWSRC